mgnify:CR=1 FL=1
MKIRKNKVDAETLKTILKAIMRKKGIKEVQLFYSDIANVEDEKVSIKQWKSGVYGEEIIDVEFIENKIII